MVNLKKKNIKFYVRKLKRLFEFYFHGNVGIIYTTKITHYFPSSAFWFKKNHFTPKGISPKFRKPKSLDRQPPPGYSLFIPYFNQSWNWSQPCIRLLAALNLLSSWLNIKRWWGTLTTDQKLLVGVIIVTILF